MTRTMSMLLFLLVATLILLGLHFYMYMRLVKDPMLPPFLRTMGTALLAIALMSMPTTMIIARYLSPNYSKWVTLGPYYWMAAFFLICVFLVAGDLLRLMWAGLGRLEVLPESWRSVDSWLWMKRGIAGLAVSIAGCLVVYGSVHQGRGPQVLHHTVVLRHAQPGLSGLRIVQLSDLHVGPTLGRKWLSDVVARVNEQKPDVVLITGDLVDGLPDKLGPEIQPLKDLTATYGTYFVTGNHEYYSGAPEWITFIEAMGIRVLKNQSVTLQVGAAQLCLAGVNDFQAAGMIPGDVSDPEKAVHGCPPGIPIILMAHDPRSVTKAANAGVSLVLAGHTHGGQLWPWTWAVLLQQKHRQGFYQVGETSLYVSAGTGYWGPPLRIGTQSEISVFDVAAH